MLGLYFVLKVSNITGLALTVLGGTGIIGIVLGFASRDIVEMPFFGSKRFELSIVSEASPAVERTWLSSLRSPPSAAVVAVFDPV